MSVNTKTYLYGDDADGHRGITVTYREVCSDYSGKVLDGDYAYESLSGGYVSREEYEEELKVSLIDTTEPCYCQVCSKLIENCIDAYKCIDYDIICVECLEDYINENRISIEDIDY